MTLAKSSCEAWLSLNVRERSQVFMKFISPSFERISSTTRVFRNESRQLERTLISHVELLVCLFVGIESFTTVSSGLGLFNGCDGNGGGTDDTGGGTGDTDGGT